MSRVTHSEPGLPMVKHLHLRGNWKRPNAASALTSEEEEEILWTAKIPGDSNLRVLSHTMWLESNWGQQMFRGSLLFRWPATQMKWKVAERLRWRKWKGASEVSHITHQQNSTADNTIQQFPKIFSVVFSDQCGTDPASKQPSCCCDKQFPQLSSHV